MKERRFLEPNIFLRTTVVLLSLASFCVASDGTTYAKSTKSSKKKHAVPLPANYLKVKEAAATLYKAQDFVNAEPLFRKALKILDAEKGSFDDEHIAILLDLSETYYRLRRVSDAQQYSTQAINFVREKFGNDSSRLPPLLSYDATLYPSKSQKRLTQLKEALRISEALVGKDSPSLLHLLGHLHDYYITTAAGIQYGQRIYDMRRKIPSFKTNGNSFNCCGYLALDYMDAGNFKAAEPLAIEAEQIESKILGPDASRTLWASTLVAIAYEKLGKTELAQKQIGKCIKGFNTADISDGHYLSMIRQSTARFLTYQMYEPAFALATIAVKKAKANPELAEPVSILPMQLTAVETAWKAGKKGEAKELYAEYQKDVRKLFKESTEQDRQLSASRKTLLANGLTDL